MPHLANAQVSRMSNKQRETKLNKDQLSNGARSGSASCDVQCFRQEAQKAILIRPVGHHTLAKSTALKWGWGGMAPLLPIVWMELFSFIKISCCLSFPDRGCSSELLTDIWAQLGPWIVHLLPVNSPGPGQSFEQGWYKKGYRLHRQSLIESVHRGQLWTNIQHVLGLLTQWGLHGLKPLQPQFFILFYYFKVSSTFHTPAMCVSHFHRQNDPLAFSLPQDHAQIIQ